MVFTLYSITTGHRTTQLQISRRQMCRSLNFDIRVERELLDSHASPDLRNLGVSKQFLPVNLGVPTGMTPSLTTSMYASFMVLKLLMSVMKMLTLT